MPDYRTLTGLVEHYSPTGKEAGAVAWLVERMGALGYREARADEAGNAVGVLGDGPRQIVLLGHIDTVPGEIPVRVEGDILHGRGSVDAKGPLAAFVDAAARVGAIPGWQVVVIGAVAEEGESHGAWHIAPRYHPQFAIIGEPSGWDRITLGYKGIARFTFRARQVLGHSAAPDESACEVAAGFWNSLVEICRRENAGTERTFEQLSPTLRGMRSGSDGFEEWAEVTGNVRLPIRVPPDAMAALFQEAAGGRGTVETTGTPLTAYRTAKSTPLVGALLAGIRAAGGTPGFNLKLGTSDISIVGPAWNCPMAVYGPGDSTLDHTPREHIALAEFGRAVDVLAYAMRRLTSRGAD
jgi:[amino group carrier protein]-lysine/ornithine hydrolase